MKKPSKTRLPVLLILAILFLFSLLSFSALTENFAEITQQGKAEAIEWGDDIRLSDNDDTGDTINPYQLKDINGISISFTKSVSGATYTITTTSVQPAGDYELWWTYSEDGDGSTLSITATIPIVFVCPDPAVGTYPNKITFHNDVSQDIYFRGHTQWAGYVTDLKLDGTTSISTSTNSGNQLYVNSEFCYYLGSVSSGTHYIEYNWEVTGTSAEMQFIVSATGWKDPTTHDLDSDGLPDYQEADMETNPEVKNENNK